MLADLKAVGDLGPEGLVAWSVPPLELSVLGLVRHMTQMEHGYLSWGLGGGERVMIYGDDDYAGGSLERTCLACLRRNLENLGPGGSDWAPEARTGPRRLGLGPGGSD